MSGWKSLALACGCLALAGGAQAQTSLFDPPAAGGGAAAAPPPADAFAPATPAAKPRPKPKGPTPARVLSITNDTGASLAAVEVSAEGKTASLKELATGKTANLRLPALKACTVAISATFQGSTFPDTHEQDICKDRKVRFTN